LKSIIETCNQLATQGVRPSEAKVGYFLMRGLCNKLIARELDICESTVKAHVSSLLRLVGAKNRTQLANYLHEQMSTRILAEVDSDSHHRCS
jgi:DNA-binding NarL/FixJ family response regulator